MDDDDSIESTSEGSSNVPAQQEKPSFLEWIGSWLPFQLPRIPLPQTAKNLDKAASRLVVAGTDNLVGRMGAATERQASLARGNQALIERGIGQIASAKDQSLDDRALAYVLGEAKVHQHNRESILEMAADDLKADPPNTDAEQVISDDWLNMFSRIAADKSDEDMQRLWAKLLAGEIRGPGSVKISTLAKLATFDKEDADFAHDFLTAAVNQEWIMEDYYENGPQYLHRMRARELDLIGDQSELTLNIGAGESYDLLLGAEVLTVTAHKELLFKLSTLPLTNLGRALRRYVVEDFLEDSYVIKVVASLQHEEATIMRGILGTKNPNGSRVIDRQVKVWPAEVRPV